MKRYIRRPEVLAKTGLAATTIYMMERRGEFPQHFMLTPRCAAWDEAEVDNWLEQRRSAYIKPAVVPDVSLRRNSRGRASEAAI